MWEAWKTYGRSGEGKWGDESGGAVDAGRRARGGGGGSGRREGRMRSEPERFVTKRGRSYAGRSEQARLRETGRVAGAAGRERETMRPRDGRRSGRVWGGRGKTSSSQERGGRGAELAWWGRGERKTEGTRRRVVRRSEK